VSYGCEKYSLTLREEDAPSVFENRVLRRILGPKGDEVRGGRWKIYKDELHNLFCSPNIIKIIKLLMIRWAKHVARMGDIKTAYESLVGKAEGKSLSGRPRRRCENNITINLWDMKLGVQTGFMQLRINTDGRVLGIRQ
jgi:hypothetical protein